MTGNLPDDLPASGDEIPPPVADLEASGLPPTAPPAPVSEAPRGGEPRLLAGRYLLRQVLGEGGMGTVWAADQVAPVQRRVAVKLIKPGLDSHAVLARFEQERQALALMDHPHIAKVLDAGLAGDTPFFVMELIPGVPLTKYCDDHRLTPRQRLELFIPVCQAVQHAHQKGIIHRDLKPGNILVGLYDGRPVPKIIDFGVAKATGVSLTEDTIGTEAGSLVGTLEYMSPEQADLGNADIDTRSDIYALGAVLYELLTGSVPFSRQELQQAGLSEMLRVIREVEPPRPSTRLSGSRTLPSVAAMRAMEPAKLTSALRGDLDWIVMKCLEKDHRRRYETANQLALELQRYLADEPVQAGPPSVRYRAWKFCRRHRVPVAGAGLIAIALIGGLAGTAWGLFRAERAAAAERAARGLAEKRLSQLERGNEILTSVFADLDIRRVREGGEPLEAVLAGRLAQAARQLDGDGIGDPLTVATLQDRLGTSLHHLGYPDAAIPLFEKARRTLAQTLATGHPDTLCSMDHLASAYQAAGKSDQALPLFDQTRKLRETHLGADHPDTLASMHNLAFAYQAAGKRDLALPLFEQTLKLRRARLGADHPETLLTMNELAFVHQVTGNLASALPLFEKVLKLRKAKLGPEHPDTLDTMNRLAAAYRAAGKVDTALALFAETLPVLKSKLGADHPSTLSTMHNLAVAYAGNGQAERAVPLFEEILDRFRAKFGSDHPSTLTSMNSLALGYQALGKLDLALPLYEESLRGKKTKLGADHPATLDSMSNLALGYQAAGKLDLALPLFVETLQLRTSRLGPTHPETLISANNLAQAHEAAGKRDLALPLYEQAARGFEKLGFLHEYAGGIVANYLRALETAGHWEHGETWHRKWLAVVRQRSGPEHPACAQALAGLGDNLLQQQKWSDAETVLRECLAVCEKAQPAAWSTFHVQSSLGGALLGQKQFAEAEPLLKAGYQGLKQHAAEIPAAEKRCLTQAIDRLRELDTALGNPGEARRWQRERGPQSASPPP